MSNEIVDIDVIFRKYKVGGDIVAIFPHEVSDLEGSVTVYEHIGQHGSANYDHMLAISNLANKAESRALKAELRGIGYNVKEYKKRVYDKYLACLYKVRS